MPRPHAARRCVNTFLSPLSEKEGKDEYAAQGYLDADLRIELLAEWGSKQTIKAQLDRAKSELEKLQKAREETASNPRDQRYMPTNMSEAILFASQDEEEALAVRQSSQVRPRFRSTPRRRSSIMADAASRSSGLSSAIQKRTFGRS